MALNLTQRNIASSFEFAEKAVRVAVMNQIAALTAAMLVGNRQNRGGTSERRPSALLPWNSTINFVQCKRFLLHCTNLRTILRSSSRRDACTESCGGTLMGASRIPRAGGALKGIGRPQSQG